jgi:hypothetical protein
MKYFFECPCGTYGNDLHDRPEGDLHWCPHCEKALVIEPRKTGPMRFATEAEITAYEVGLRKLYESFTIKRDN